MTIIAHRWRWTAAAALLIVAAFAACEASGWPFLVGPLQRWASQALARNVAFDSDGGQDGRVRIGLFGSVRVRAPTLSIAAPAWSPAPHMLLAHNADLKLAYGDLWRAGRGGPLRIRELHAEQIDVHIERLADGRASWQFGAPKAPTPGEVARLPSFGELRVGDGVLRFIDAVLEADLDVRFSLTEKAAEAASAGHSSGLQLHATGQYRKLPLKVELLSTGVLELADTDASKFTQPVIFNATIGRASMHFKGVAADALHLTALRGRFDVTGPSLAAVGDPLGLTLPTTGAFKTKGSLGKDGDVWSAVLDEIAIGESRLSGAFTFDRSHDVPLLTGRLNGSKVLLADLGPAIGGRSRDAALTAAPVATQAAVAEKKPGKVLPDRRFDLPALKAMNANLLLDIADFDLGTALLEPLRPLRTHLRLWQGVLSLSEIEARTAQGRLSGDLRLDGRNAEALWTADLKLLGVRLEQWLHQNRKNNAPPFIGGLMDGQVQVAGSGRSTAEILGSLEGEMRFHLRQATLSHLAVEMAGIDFAQALGVFIKGDDALTIDCNAIDLAVAKGMARPRIFIIDTRDSTIGIEGTLSLQSEALDLTAIVSPKDFSPLTLRTPIHVTGTFAAPKVALEKGKLGGKVGVAALLALINPLAAVVPLIDPGAQEDARRDAVQCAALAHRGAFAAMPAKVRPIK